LTGTHSFDESEMDVTVGGSAPLVYKNLKFIMQILKSSLSLLVQLLLQYTHSSAANLHTFALEIYSAFHERKN